MKTISSVGVMSVAKILGALQAILGLLIAPMFLLMGMVGSMAGQHPNPFGAIGGVVLAVIVPVVYGAFGFIFGAMGALLYNLLAKWMGGIQFEVRDAKLTLFPSASSMS